MIRRKTGTRKRGRPAARGGRYGGAAPVFSPGSGAGARTAVRVAQWLGRYSRVHGNPIGRPAHLFKAENLGVGPDRLGLGKRLSLPRRLPNAGPVWPG